MSGSKVRKHYIKMKVELIQQTVNPIGAKYSNKEKIR